jgi:TPR repeat protein
MNFLSFCHRVVAQNADLAFRWFQEACENPD